MSQSPQDAAYTQLYTRIRQLVLDARQAVSHAVDTCQVMASFEIGRHIVEHEQQGAQRAEYGKQVLKELAHQLTGEFGRGFSRSNLEYMRKFFLIYRDRLPDKSQMPSGKFQPAPPHKSQMPSGTLPEAAPFGQQPAAQMPFRLSWSQYVFLVGIKSNEERAFYEIEAASNGWTLPELKRQFNAGLYERLALSRDQDGIRQLAQQGQAVTAPKDQLKDPYVLEFLGLEERDRYSENDLETAIIDKLEHFLLELGKGFLFEARQKRFTLDGDHFFVDLVFYNRLLRCYVLVDLKLGKLAHQDLGQMQMYVNYFDRYVKQDDEAPTVGITAVQDEKRRAGGNHPAQGQQHHRRALPDLSAGQGNTEAGTAALGGRARRRR